MQILEIVLYGKQQQKRSLPLQIGRPNIITGASTTGKTALADIVDYCLGRGECRIAEGVIRENTSWYGLRLQFSKGQIFVARQNPPIGQATTNKSYIQQGDVVPSPLTAPEANTTIEAIQEELTRRIGISPNLHTPPVGQSRRALEANIRHALIYCFQQQWEIASKSILFHRQDEDHMTQTIRDTLPYFLGAIREDGLALEQQLKIARRELRNAERVLLDAESIRGDGLSRAVSLFAEAVEVGLIQGAEPTRLEEGVVLMKEIARWTPEEVRFVGSERLSQIQQEASELREQLKTKEDTIHAVATYANEAEGYTSELHQQELRLESIGLFDGAEHDSSACPLCLQAMQVQAPTVESIRDALRQVRSNLEETLRERPRVREYLDRLQTESFDLKQQISERQEEANAIIESQDESRRLRDLYVRRARVVGRISLWLDSVDLTDNTSSLREAEARIRERVEGLEQQLSGTEKEERLSSILNRLGTLMTQWSDFLELEHSGNPVRLDLTHCTVVVDREDRPIPLNIIGSGKNWVGAHLIAHLSLHKYFREHSRPVPGFLFLDQPTQAFYPAERDEEFVGFTQNLVDEDRQNVQRIFNLLFDVTESLNNGLQLIITDHADLIGDSRFQSYVVEKWRDGRKLIPEEWYS